MKQVSKISPISHNIEGRRVAIGIDLIPLGTLRHPHRSWIHHLHGTKRHSSNTIFAGWCVIPHNLVGCNEVVPIDGETPPNENGKDTKNQVTRHYSGIVLVNKIEMVSGIYYGKLYVLFL